MLRVPTGVYAQPQATEPPVPSLTQPLLDRALGFLRGHRLLVGGSALGLLFVLTTAILALSHGPAPAPAAAAIAPATATAPAAPTPLVTKVVDTVELSVAVSPSHAQVLIDGELMPSNPFLGRFARSTTMHRIRAVAPGYEPRERLVTFADNVLLDLSLTPRPGAVAAGVVAPPPKEPPVLRVETTPPPAPTRRVERARVTRTAPQPVARPAATPPAPVAAPPPAPPPRATAPAADIAPRSGTEPPRRRAIDATNPYGDDK